jgi:hypothetical protein
LFSRKKSRLAQPKTNLEQLEMKLGSLLITNSTTIRIRLKIKD